MFVYFRDQYLVNVCIAGYITYPGIGNLNKNLNEYCQICFHPSYTHIDAPQTTGKSTFSKDLD